MNKNLKEKIKNAFPKNIKGDVACIKLKDLIDNKSLSRNDLSEIAKDCNIELFINLKIKVDIVAEIFKFFKDNGIDCNELPDFLIAKKSIDSKELYIRVIIDKKDKVTAAKMFSLIDDFTSSNGDYIALLDIKQIDTSNKKLLRDLTSSEFDYE